MMDYSRRTLREWRAKKDLTKRNVAEQLNVHPSTYARWERKPEEIKMADAVRLTKVFDCNLNDINFFEENPNLNLESACS